MTWEYTSNWYADCPACNSRYGRKDFPCPNCHRRELVYYRDFEMGSGYLLRNQSSLRCLKENFNIYAFECPKCEAAIPMGCIAGFVTRHKNNDTILAGMARSNAGLLAGVCAAVPFLGLSGFFTGKVQENIGLAALVIGFSTYLYVRRYMKIYHSNMWMYWSNE